MLRTAGRLASGPFHFARDHFAKAGPVKIQTRKVPKLLSRFTSIGFIGHAHIAASAQRDLCRTITQCQDSLRYILLIFNTRPIHINFIALHG